MKMLIFGHFANLANLLVDGQTFYRRKLKKVAARSNQRCGIFTSKFVFEERLSLTSITASFQQAFTFNHLTTGSAPKDHHQPVRLSSTINNACISTQRRTQPVRLRLLLAVRSLPATQYKPQPRRQKTSSIRRIHPGVPKSIPVRTPNR